MREPKKRCWCRKTCGKVLCHTTRRQHYRSAVNAGEEDGIQPSEDENMIVDVARDDSDVNHTVSENNSSLGSMSNSDSDSGSGSGLGSDTDSEINSNSHHKSNNSDWEWREMDEASQSDDNLMGDEELLEELEESMVNRQQELSNFSMCKS